MFKFSTRLYTVMTSQLNYQDTTELTFLDSSGNSFKPNYMRFSASEIDPTPTGGFLVEFRLSGTTPGLVITSAVNPIHAWNGVYVDSRQHGMMEIDFSDNERPTGISIRNGTSNANRLVIIYGQKSIENPLRSQGRGKGR